MGHKWERYENETLPLSNLIPMDLAHSVSENGNGAREPCAGNKKKQQQQQQQRQQPQTTRQQQEQQQQQ